MEYQKIMNLLDNKISHLNLGEEIGLKKMINHEEHIKNIIKLI